MTLEKFLTKLTSYIQQINNRYNRFQITIGEQLVNSENLRASFLVTVRLRSPRTMTIKVKNPEEYDQVRKAVNDITGHYSNKDFEDLNTWSYE